MQKKLYFKCAPIEEDKINLYQDVVSKSSNPHFAIITHDSYVAHCCRLDIGSPYMTDTRKVKVGHRNWQIYISQGKHNTWLIWRK